MHRGLMGVNVSIVMVMVMVTVTVNNIYTRNPNTNP